MSKTFYISDPHFFHKNVIIYDKRPFENENEMNEEMIRRWNAQVSPKDTVYILGDLSWTGPDKTEDILKRLNGNLILIMGNHDKFLKPSTKKYFKEIHPSYWEIKDGDNFLVLSHYPIIAFNNHMHGAIHLYGHVHNTTDDAKIVDRYKEDYERTYGRKPRMYAVGAMMPYMDYTPRTLEEILKANEE